MKNVEKVIEMLCGEGRPKSAWHASLTLATLHNTGDSPDHGGVVLNLTELMCERRSALGPSDTLTCFSAIGIALPESMAKIIDYGSRIGAGRIDWNEFAIGCFEALAYLEESPEGLADESHRPLKVEIEKELANLLIARREKEGPNLSDKESGRLANLAPAFVKGYDVQNLLRLVKDKIDWDRCQGDPRTQAPLQIIAELCWKTFASRSLGERVATLLRTK